MRFILIYIFLFISMAPIPFGFSPITFQPPPGGVFGVLGGSVTEVAGYFFGNSIDISKNGRVLVVGFPGFDDVNGDSGRVLVYHYTNVASTWTTKTLTKTAASGNFGKAVAISGDGYYVIASAIYNSEIAPNAGKVFVYKYNGTVWNQINEFNSNVNNDYLGIGVAITLTGDRVFICGNHSSQMGSVKIYRNQADTFVLEQEIINPTGLFAEAFCENNSISVDDLGTTMIIGANGADKGSFTNSGVAHVFTRTNTTWSLKQTLPNNFNFGDEQYGYSVSISGDGNKIAVGAPFYGAYASAAGGVETWTLSGGTYIHQDYLKETSFTTSERFGWSVSLNYDGTNLAVGVPYDDTYATNGGKVRFYYKQYFDNAYIDYFESLGPIASNLYGWKVSMADNGIHAIAEPSGDTNCANCGTVNVRY